MMSKTTIANTQKQKVPAHRKNKLLTLEENDTKTQDELNKEKLDFEELHENNQRVKLLQAKLDALIVKVQALDTSDKEEESPISALKRFKDQFSEINAKPIS